MKKIILLFLLIVASFQGFSQTPGISYQAVILNPNTKELPGANAQTSILANRNVVIRFTIINESSQQEYQEYHQTTTDAYGMINLLIGHGTRISASYFQDVLWNGLSKKLKVDIDFSGGGNNFAFLSEQELTFMPQPALGQDSQAVVNNTASILAEVTRATNAESVIQTNVDAIEAVSILADDILQTNIDNVQADVDAIEATATASIQVVQTNVDTNEAASILADATLQINIDNVQTDVDANEAARILADATLQTNIDNVQTDVDANQAARILADATLQTNIDNVQTYVDANEAARILADATLQTNIDNVQTDVDANEAARILADATLQTNIDNVQTDVDANEAARILADAELQVNIDSIAASTTTAIAVVQTDVDNNEAASILADATLQTHINNVQADVDANEAASILTDATLQTNIDNVQTDVDANEAATQTALNLKANSASPTFTGTPLAPTAIAGTNTTQLATTAFVTNAVSMATTGNFVDLTTAQTIAGVKTFSSDAEINGVTVGRGNFNENSNTAIGLGALSSNAGYANTGIGRGTLANNAAANGNTALGYIALSNNISGTDNVAIGTQTLETNLTGSENTAIGKHADVVSDGISNSVAIGANAIVTASNTIQLGSDGSGSHTAITNVNTSGAITAASYIKSGGTSSEYLMADGSVSTGAVPVREVADEFSAIASQTNFTLTQTPSVNSKVKMFVNGIRISNAAYSVIGTTLTYNPANNGGYDLTVGDRIQFDFYY